MSRYSRLRGDYAIIAQTGAAGKTCLSHDDAVSADDDVMGDMDEVVDFGPLADDGGAERGAVDGCVSADLDIVVNDDVTDLQHLAMATFIQHIAVTVRTNHAAGVKSDSVSDLASCVNDHIRVEANIIPDLTVSANVVAA